MKKTLYIMAALLLGAFSMHAAPTALPDTTAARERLDRIEDAAQDVIKKRLPSKGDDEPEGFVSFDGLSRIGMGCIIARDADVFDAKKNKSFEIWFNAAEVSLNPAEWLSFTLGIDLKWDSFYAGDNWYATLDDNGKLSFIDIASVRDPGINGKFISKVNLFSLTAPLALQLNFGGFGFRAGAEAAYCLRGNLVQKNVYGDTKETARTRLRNGNIPAFYWDAFVEFSFDDLGFYARYCPQELVPGTGMQSFTAGILLGF